MNHQVFEKFEKDNEAQGTSGIIPYALLKRMLTQVVVSLSLMLSGINHQVEGIHIPKGCVFPGISVRWLRKIPVTLWLRQFIGDELAHESGLYLLVYPV